MRFRPVALRTLFATAAVAAAVALGGCDPEQLRFDKSMRPLSSDMLSAFEQKHMDKGSPIVVRIYKEEAELEVWKQDQGGRFQLLKTYPICRWSGELGPKVKEGDRQAPEGFYTITQANLNPNSAYYLSINIGYPNEFDRAWNRTGSALMIHGDCSSRGCYAMTNEQIGEIYGLARESFLGGQRAFQIQAYPFRMTALNMAKHRNNPNMSFWRNLKQGSDMFELSGVQPTVNVCDRRYVFNAEAPAGSTTPLKFVPAGHCPAYTIEPDLQAALTDKTQRDEAEFAELSRTTATAPVKTGHDGGMHPTFLAKVTRTIRDENGNTRTVIDENAASMLGSYVNPPHETDGTLVGPETTAASRPAANPVVANVPMPRPSPHPHRSPPPETASLSPSALSLAASDSENPISRVGSTVGKWFGLGGGDDNKAPPPPVTRAPKPRPTAVAARKPVPVPPEKPATVAAVRTPKLQPRAETPEPAPELRASNTPPAAPSVLSGAQPVVPADSFESRWAPAH